LGAHITFYHALCQIDRDVDVIRVHRRNTVRSLRDQLQALVCSGNGDSGFPILRGGDDEDSLRMIGYIGANELEHALSMFFPRVLYEPLTLNDFFPQGIVADNSDDEVHFHTNYERRDMNSSSFSSLLEASDGVDPFDFSVYMDQVC
jgi:chloride channel 3/4/5